MSSSRIATIVLLLSSIFWGLAWIPLKKLSSLGIDGVFLTFVCYGVMSLMLLPFVCRNASKYLSSYKPLLGIFFAGGLANLCFNYAMIYGEVVRVMVLFYLLPVWGVLGGRFILKEKTDAWRWLGVGLAIVGAFILLGGSKMIEQPPSWIDFISLLSGLFFAANIMLFRAVEQVPLGLKLNVLFVGCCIISGVLLLLGAESVDTPLNMTAIAWAIFFAVAWLFWANLGSQWAVTKMPAGRSSILIIIELIAAVLSAMWIGGEVLTIHIVIGGLLVLSATGIEVFRGDKA